MTTVILKLKNNKEVNFLLDLLNRLHISFEWGEEKIVKPLPSEQNKDSIAELYGSWQSNLSSDEIASSIRAARVNQTREIALWNTF